MKHNRILFPLLMIAGLIGVALRLWALKAAMAAGGLPVDNHISTYLTAIFSIIMVVLFLCFALTSPGHSGKMTVLDYSAKQFIPAMIGAILILAGAAVEFVENLLFIPNFSALFMCLGGFCAGICLMLVAYSRRTGSHRYPGAHLIPIIYLVIKLILNFKNWSTDPIILDYCFILFALIFSLLAFYHSTGFFFNKGKSRKALFYCLSAVFFSAMAAAEGIGSGSLSTFVTYLGLLVWCCPVIAAVIVPSEPDPKPESQNKQ